MSYTFNKITIALQKYPHLVIVFMVMMIFLFSANKAWFHNRANSDGTYFVEAYPKNIPFMWQYDTDAMTFLGSTAFFPAFYKSSPQLLGRPALPLLSHLAGKSILILTRPFIGKILDSYLNSKSAIAEAVKKDLSKINIEGNKPSEILTPIVSAIIGLIIVKISFYTLTGILFFKLASKYTDQKISILAVFLLFFSSGAMNSIGTYHTYEFGFLTPIIVIYLFHKLCDSYSIKRNIVFSLIIGYLMLAKANYASYIAVILYAAIFLRHHKMVLKGIIISVLVHLIPWIVWTAFIETNGMPVIGFITKSSPLALAIHPLDIILRKINGLNLVTTLKASGGSSQPGSDIIYIFSNMGVIQILQIIKNNIINSIGVLGTMTGLLAAFSVGLFKNKLKHQLYIFIVIFFCTTWFQAFISFPYGPKTRALSDVNFIICGLASFTIMHVLRMHFNSIKNNVLIIFIITYISSNILNFVTIPWVHPFEQAKNTSIIR